MKNILAVAIGICLALATSANAEVKSAQVCQNVTLAASTTTDCTVTDISKFKFFSFQVYCGETTGNTMDIDVDWVEGSANGSGYLGVPLGTDGTAISQLKTNYTTEDAWSVLQSVQPPVAPVATIRFTENNGDDDIVCSAIINMGD